MNLMETECQELADKYCMAIKEIRLIRRTDPAPLIITPTRKPELMAVPFQNLPFNREFQDFTKKVLPHGSGSPGHLFQWLWGSAVLPPRHTGPCGVNLKCAPGGIETVN